jgi:hypothetical protein
MNIRPFSDQIKQPDWPKLADITGPGLITGASEDDPSGIATYSQAGAQCGYSDGSSGRIAGLTDIITSLRRDGYSASEIEGPLLKRQLADLRRARAGRVPPDGTMHERKWPAEPDRDPFAALCASIIDVGNSAGNRRALVEIADSANPVITVRHN